MWLPEKLCPEGSWLRGDGIERAIQGEHVHTGISENTEVSGVCVLLDQFAKLLLAQAASFADTWQLKFGVAWADMRVEAAARRGNGIGGHRIGVAQAVLFALGGNAIFDRVIQLL